jgi:hypothetical protein
MYAVSDDFLAAIATHHTVVWYVDFLQTDRRRPDR